MYRNVASSPDNCSTIPPIVGSAATLSPPSRAVVRSSGRPRFPLATVRRPWAGVVHGVRDRISRLHREQGTTVTLIGQSSGGVFARLYPREDHGDRSADHAR